VTDRLGDPDQGNGHDCPTPTTAAPLVTTTTTVAPAGTTTVAPAVRPAAAVSPAAVRVQPRLTG
jgi:hypothetical protein